MASAMSGRWRVGALPGWSLALAGALVVLVLPYLGIGLDVQRQIVLIAILALPVSGLNLSLGFAGELALGQVAVYAIGAYLTGYLGAHGHTNLILEVAVACAGALLIGLLTGIPGLRLGSWSLAMTSFFLVLLIPDLLEILRSFTGGPLGLSGIAPPTLFGQTLTNRSFYVTVIILTILWFVVLRNLVNSRHGIALRVLRQSPVLASSLGISVFRLKVVAYALGAIPAGVAGCLFANVDLYLSPGSFSFSLTITMLAACILGGASSVYGAIFGAAVLQLGPLKSTDFEQYALMVYGAFLLIGGVLLKGGAARAATVVLRAAARRTTLLTADRVLAGESSPKPRLGGPDNKPAIGSIPGKQLRVDGVTKSFGGVEALRDVSLVAPSGKISALIGPNGSGKTTLLNVICGFYRPDGGRLDLGETALVDQAPHEVARSGVARTFQTTNIPTGISVLEAVAAARYGIEHSNLIGAVTRLPGARRIEARDHELGLMALRQVGLEHLADEEAATLPLGTRRLIELARCLVGRPALLLLDEVASGLDEAEIAQLAQVIRRISEAGGTVVLVEHNFELVLAVSDHVNVLAQGVVIASGSPDEIQRNSRVVSEYLGIRSDDVDAVLEELA